MYYEDISLRVVAEIPGTNMKEFLDTILSASIRKYNDVLSGAQS
jgi:hypothetical protein